MVDTQKKLPSIQWYPGDWRKDPGVQAADFHVRGVWFECCMLMHESEDRGKLILNGRPMPDPAIARLLGMHLDEWLEARTIILEYGIGTEDEHGALCCRRMVRDENLRRIRASAGAKGGRSTQADRKQAKPQQTPSKPPSKAESKTEARGTAPLSHEPDDDAKQTRSKTEASGKQNPTPSSSSSTSTASSTTSDGVSRARTREAPPPTDRQLLEHFNELVRQFGGGSLTDAERAYLEHVPERISPGDLLTARRRYCESLSDQKFRKPLGRWIRGREYDDDRFRPESDDEFLKRVGAG